MLKKQVEPGTSLIRQSVKIKTILHQRVKYYQLLLVF